MIKPEVFGQEFVNKTAPLLATEAQLTLQLKSVQLKKAVAIALELNKLTIDEEHKPFSDRWVANADGTYTGFSYGDYGANLRITQCTQPEILQYDFPDSMVGEHFILKLDGAARVVEIESYNADGMRHAGVTGGYRGGDFRHVIDMTTEESMSKGIESGFPVDAFAKLMDSFGAP